MAGPVNITGLPPVRPTVEMRPGAQVGRPDAPHSVSKPFAEFLSEQVSQVNMVHKEADEAVAAVATGRSNNLHEMMIALDKADVSFRMLTKVRNKAVEAYQEVMRMSI
jgi:flagellar hook-basal body complex protein FliE